MTTDRSDVAVESQRYAAARAVILDGLALQAYPAAVVEVGNSARAHWREAFGRLTYDASASATTTDTIFDLASLTKVIATTALVMRAVETGRLSLDARVADFQSGWRTGDRAGVTLRQLLDHSSGLPARIRIWEEGRGRVEFERRIAATPLEYEPGSRSVYCDLDFILLGFVLEDIARAPLDAQFAALAGELGAAPLAYLPGRGLVDRIAPTENDPWRGRILRGEVHDENAAALDGVAGHAGLFGTAASVGAFARTVLRTFTQPTVLGSSSMMRVFAARTGVPGSSRALGWDTMLPTSSCGTKMSPAAIGHTGFTGTSLWIDRDLDLYVAFLTNRVHPTRANEKLLALRPRLHDAIVGAP